VQRGGDEKLLVQKQARALLNSAPGAPETHDLIEG
jgi:hypothetical protein